MPRFWHSKRGTGDPPKRNWRGSRIACGRLLCLLLGAASCTIRGVASTPLATIVPPSLPAVEFQEPDRKGNVLCLDEKNAMSLAERERIRGQYEDQLLTILQFCR